MTTGLFHDQNLEKQIEKQMGCMTGFRQLFDRHHILTGKRLYNTGRLPHYPASECSSMSERSVESSPVYSRELRTPRHQHQHQQEQEQPKQNHRTSCSPTPELHSPAPGYLQSPVRTPMHLPVFEFKEGLRSSWKFKEAPRLSLDSRATVDGKGKLYPKENRTIAAKVAAKNEKPRSSPSVIAKLMGLEALPESGREPVQKAELRRSASESRVSRDLRFMDGNNYQTSSGYVRDNAVSEVQVQRSKGRGSPDLNRKPESQKMNGGLVVPSLKSHQHQHQHQQQRKSYFDAQDVFPEPKQAGSLYGEIEKRLKLRGIDEPAKDLETLKQILEALQLKGLLHSNTREAEQIRNGSRSNIIIDRRLEESPIVVMKPSRSVPMRGGAVPDSPLNLRSKHFGVHKNYNIVSEPEQSIRPRREQTEIDRKVPNQRRNHPNDKSPRRRQNNNIENQNQGRRTDDSMKQRKSNTGYSPKNQLTTNKSPRNRRSGVETCRISPNEDESSTISESSRSTSSQVDTETKVENYKEGRSLLARCDKLLNSIAEITATSGNELQPSPVSVLDSSSLYYKDESSPSPVMKRSIDFKDRLEELEEDNWSPVISPVRLKFNENEKSDDCDFLYVSEILRASNSLSEDTDIFLLLEKHQYKSSNSSDPYSKLHRKLVFDTVTELLQKKKQLPPWKAVSAVTITGKPSLQHIWSEFLRIKEREPVEDLFEVICGVLRKDMAGDAVHEWDECQMETSEAVLDIERMIFKDLIGETIRDLASFAGNSRVSRRKLVF